MNGASSCGGSGTEDPSLGGVATVTQPMLVVMAIWRQGFVEAYATTAVATAEPAVRVSMTQS
jgi:hypothetical protein